MNLGNKYSIFKTPLQNNQQFSKCPKIHSCKYFLQDLANIDSYVDDFHAGYEYKYNFMVTMMMVVCLIMLKLNEEMRLIESQDIRLHLTSYGHI